MSGAPRTITASWLRLAAWAVLVAALGLLGTGLADRLAPTTLLVPGTPSERAHAQLKREFGNSIPVTFLIEGPAVEVDRQGPRLVRALRDEERVRVMSPWDSPRGELGSLRPKPGAALVVASFQRPDSEAMDVVVPTAKRIAASAVDGPLRVHVGGVAAIAVALQENALSATHDAELLVAPILIVVLLLVFRSPVAAALPLLVGAATVVAGRGLLVLSTSLVPVNAIAVAIASMMGLALGVDYALLMVSRFRQERDEGADDEVAISTAASASGQTIAFAGATLAVAMTAAALVAPGDLLLSVAAGVVVSALLSIALAVSLMPALLRVLLPHVDRWRLPSLGRGEGMVGLAGRAISRPWVAIPLIVIPILVVSAPAAALSIGAPDPRQLPPSDPTRQGFEALRKAIGPGWAAPFAVIATAREGPISAPGRIEAISRWQDRIASDPAVAAVIGPAALAPAGAPVRKLRRAYARAPQQLAEGRRGIAKLRSGLREAGEAVSTLRDGLGTAADGAATIASRTREAGAGAARLERGLGRASAGARRLSAGLDRAERGAARLLAGQRRLSGGAARLAAGLRRLDDTLRGALGPLREVATRLRAWSAWLRALRVPTEMTAESLDHAMRELNRMSVGRDDPRYEELAAAVREAAALVGVPAAAPVDGALLPEGAPRSLGAAIVAIEEQLARSVESLARLPERIERLSGAVTKLRRGAGRVAAGSRATERGGRALHRALARLARGGRLLERGLGGAHADSGRLPDGLSAIAAGADELSGGLRDGRARTGELVAGLSDADEPLGRYQVTLRSYGRDLRTVRARSPGAIDSGHLMLAALDGTVPGIREQVVQVANLDRGAQSVRMLIVPKAGPSAAATVRLSDRLQERLPALARAARADVEIGEGAQSLADYTQETMKRVPWLVFALCLVSVLMLIAVLRSLLLPLVAVGLNLLTVAAAFGALELLFRLDLLVGPPYVDAISAAGVLTIMFVLSIDYEVFLLSRMREVWLQTHDHDHAISQGLRHTAGVITGAAVIMSSVFLVFATTDIASLQQFGAGLTFAVVLDATVVRLVLLPAAMRALGPRVWWLPGWLDRRIPTIRHGAVPAPAGEAPREVEAVPPEPPPDEVSPIRRLGAVAHAEHRQMLDLLTQVEIASEQLRTKRVVALVRQLRELAEPHFRYEQQALFPQLRETLGPDHVAGLYAAQESVGEALARIEELAGSIEVRESAAAETRRLLRSARTSIVSCDALSGVVERQPPEVAERILDAREHVLAAAGPGSSAYALATDGRR
jgi:RND superfamily putative drug exporter